MGRELKRKEAKRNGTNIKKINTTTDSIEGKSALKITLIVVCSLILLYLIIAIFVTKELDLSTGDENTTENTNTTSVSNAILAASTFKQSEETYYVFFYGFNNEDDASIASSVSSNLTDYKVYKVDTDSSLNQNYVSDTSNPNVTSIENLKVTSPTLIQISADKVTEYIEGEDNIEAYLAK